MRKLSFLRSLKGCLKSRVAFVDFMFMGQCGSLVLERFSAAVAKEAIEKIPLQLLSRNLAQQSVMCRGEYRVSAHRGDSMLHHTCVHHVLNHSLSQFVELLRHCSSKWTSFVAQYAGLNFRRTELSRMAVEPRKPRKFSTTKIKVHMVHSHGGIHSFL